VLDQDAGAAIPRGVLTVFMSGQRFHETAAHPLPHVRFVSRTSPSRNAPDIRSRHLKLKQRSSTLNTQNAGGTVTNAITGEHLLDLFTTEKWQDLFATLSDALGFTLSIYAESGNPIFVPEGADPLRKAFRSVSSEFSAQREKHCHFIIVGTIRSAKPRLFKSYAKLMAFAVPIEYMGEKAVILGHGSFASYDDFRESMNLVSSFGMDPVSLRMPLAFTDPRHAWKVCCFVSDSVARLLKNTQEAVTLRRKFESLKSVFGTWGAASEEQPQALFRDMISKLSTLLDIECMAILILDQQQRKYMSLYQVLKSGRPAEVLSISEHDTIVKDLLGGKPFVLSAEPVTDPRADFLVGMGALYFFPVMVNKKLEAILRVADRVLKEGDRQIITAFCNQTALSLENQRLHRDLYKKFDRFAAISELTKAITPIQNDKKLLRMILNKSAELLKAEQGSLMLLDHETDVLLLEAKMGIIEGVTEKLRINRGEGIAGKVAELGEPLLVENLENDPRIKQKNRQHYKTRSFVSVPLKIEDRIIGVLNLSDKTSGEVFNEEDLDLVQSFASQAAIVMERNVFYKKTEELKKLTITDHLTGLLNRRYLHERLKDEVARSRRHGHHLSLLMLDLDGFKIINDTFGHLFGDQILVGIAETLLNTVRSMDVVARYGGDEFMIILPETVESLAVEIAERLRNTVAHQGVPPQEAAETGLPLLSASIGIVCFPRHGETVELLLENVDKVLYRAKHKGKNRIEVFS
jgi:diguanylate cyclase (GGDEF)-like protein